MKLIVSHLSTLFIFILIVSFPYSYASLEDKIKIANRYEKAEKDLREEYNALHQKNKNQSFQNFLQEKKVQYKTDKDMGQLINLLITIESNYDHIKRNNIQPFSLMSKDQFVDSIVKMSIDEGQQKYGKYIYEDEPGYLAGRFNGFSSLFSKQCKAPLISPDIHEKLHDIIITGVTLDSGRETSISRMGYRDSEKVAMDAAKETLKETMTKNDVLEVAESSKRKMKNGDLIEAYKTKSPGMPSKLSDAGREYILNWEENDKDFNSHKEEKGLVNKLKNKIHRQHRPPFGSWFSLSEVKNRENVLQEEIVQIKFQNKKGSTKQAQYLIERFEDHLKNKKNPPDKMQEVIRLLKDLEISHLFLDGNGRVHQTFLAYMTYCLSGQIHYLSDPNDLDYKGIQEIQDRLQRIKVENDFNPNKIIKEIQKKPCS